MLVVVFKDNGEEAVNIFWEADKSIDKAFVELNDHGVDAVNMFLIS